MWPSCVRCRTADRTWVAADPEASKSWLNLRNLIVRTVLASSFNCMQEQWSCKRSNKWILVAFLCNFCMKVARSGSYIFTLTLSCNLWAQIGKKNLAKNSSKSFVVQLFGVVTSTVKLWRAKSISSDKSLNVTLWNLFVPCVWELLACGLQCDIFFCRAYCCTSNAEIRDSPSQSAFGKDGFGNPCHLRCCLLIYVCVQVHGLWALH